MKTLYFFIFFNIVTSICYSQQKFTMNQGATIQKGYFTEIDYENVRGKIIVNGSINGKNYRFIVDTGAPNIITKALFTALNPTVLSKIPIKDSNGKMDSLTVVQLNKIALGNVVFDEIPALVANDSFIFDCYKVDGFIGSNMLRNSIIQFSSKDSKLILTDQLEKLALTKKHSSDLFLTETQSSPYFKIKVKGQNKGTIELLFDSGMEGLYDLALKHYAILEKKNIFTVLAKSKGRKSIGFHGSGDETDQYQLRLPELNINGAILKNLSVYTTASENSRIGSDLLKYGFVTIDYKNKKIYFEPFEASIDLYHKSFPVSSILVENKVVIGVIWDEKLKSQINLGDELITVDDVDYTNIDKCDLLTKKKIFEGKDRAELTLRGSNGVIKKIMVSKND